MKKKMDSVNKIWNTDFKHSNKQVGIIIAII